MRGACDRLRSLAIRLETEKGLRLRTSHRVGFFPSHGAFGCMEHKTRQVHISFGLDQFGLDSTIYSFLRHSQCRLLLRRKKNFLRKTYIERNRVVGKVPNKKRCRLLLLQNCYAIAATILVAFWTFESPSRPFLCFGSGFGIRDGVG